MFSKVLDSSNQEEQPFQPPTRKKKKKILLRNAFAGSLKLEALQLQPGGLGGRAGGTGVLEWSTARKVAVAFNSSGGFAIWQTWVQVLPLVLSQLQGLGQVT